MVGRKTVGTILAVISIIVVILAYTYNSYRTKRVLSPVIETKLGKIQGTTLISRSGREFYEFLGLPYAEPPIKNLRFEPPQPVKSWGPEIRDASLYGSECAQLRLLLGTYGGEEDCLYLNIFVPKERTKLLPVMVFLHGGAFVTGSANGYRPRYWMDEDVILVTINYRLAALGFINTGDGLIEGNMGLKDQVEALRWVNQHIDSFGGEKSQITLIGESAGSASASFHLVSPLSSGLFSKAIMQSGAFTGNWSVFREPAKQAKRFAAKFDCPTDNTTEMVECMRNVDVKTFVNGHQEILLPLREQITLFVPTIETLKGKETFLIEDPVKLLESGQINNVSVIAGVNAQEGLLTSAIITSNNSKLAQANNEYNFWAGRILNYPEEKTDVSAKIRKFYFGDVENIASKDLVLNYTNLFSDRMFFIPLHKFAKGFSKNKITPLRLYFYTHKGKFSFARLLISTQKPYLPVIANVLLDMAWLWVEESVFGWEVPHPGVCHADELPLFFDWQLSPSITETSKDYQISKDIVNLWTSFAQNNEKLMFKDVEWKKVDPNAKTLQYLRISEDPAMIEEPFESREKFWETLGV